MFGFLWIPTTFPLNKVIYWHCQIISIKSNKPLLSAMKQTEVRGAVAVWLPVIFDLPIMPSSILRDSRLIVQVHFILFYFMRPQHNAVSHKYP
jgi:hypothetical protein